MANIFAGFNVAVAKQTIAFVDCGLTVDNIVAIYLIQPQALKSYDPTRRLNAITQFDAGEGYYIIAKLDLDLSGVVSTTAADTGGTGGSTGGAILLEDGTSLLNEGAAP